MADYLNSKIYKIVCGVTGLVYVGSTTSTLAKRLSQHESHFKSFFLNNKGCYRSSYRILENEDYNIELLEKFPCNNKLELLEREAYYTNIIDCVNIIKKQGILLKLGRIEYRKPHDIKYYLKNKEAVKEKQKLAYRRSKLYSTILNGLRLIKAIDKMVLDK